MAIYYKDTLVAGSGGSDGLPTTGGTMSGDINMDSNKITNLPEPTQDGDAANKTYVDSATTGFLALSGGTMAGEINMGGKKLSNLATPTSNYDAATKRYVDQEIVSSALPIDGGVMTGEINMNGNKITAIQNPSASQDAATKAYVDGQFNSSHFLSVNGGTMFGPINMDEQKITNLQTPTNNSDAATKRYVDQHRAVETIMTYMGTHPTQTQITFPFTPAFVIIFALNEQMLDSNGDVRWGFVTQQYSTSENVSLSGMRLSVGTGTTNKLNSTGINYVCVAFS